ncbi:long-chain fatty acid--CoA ligase [Gordonia paraffinivorans]|nr:long-chain fatty acid--CoA ligase [Gordonia paraffinivorans]
MRVNDLLDAARDTNPDGIATVFGERRRTWREVHERVSRLAAGLRAAGVRPGDPVAVLAVNSDRYLEAHLAAPWAGAVLVPLNIRWNAQENLFALNDFGVSVLLVDDAFLDQVPQLRDGAGLTTLIYIGEHGQAPDGMRHYEDLVASAEPMPAAPGTADDPYVVFYTSGTTGQSKGVALTHGNAVATAEAFRATIDVGPDSVHLHVLGLFHVGGSQPVWYITAVGGTHVLHEKYVPADVLATIENESVTNTVLVPTMINALLTEPGLADRDLSSMRTCVYGGSPMPRQILDRAIEGLPDWGFHQIYGMTESSGYGVCLTWNDHLTALRDDPERLKSAGRAVPGADVGVVDPDDRMLGAGEIGQIVLRGPTVMTGYHGNPTATEQTLANGWLHTGDAGYLDDAGFLYVSDRVKDMIITGGENVFSVDVERAIYTHPAVHECAVIGIPDPTWVEAVHAVVVLRDGARVSEAELIEHCRTQIGGYKCPRSVEFVAGPLPTTPSGKIRKNVLRDPWWTGQDRQI